jgi:hypothetical protein
MYDVYFRYVYCNDILCERINKIEIEGSSGYIQVSGEELSTYHFRIHGTLYLYSDRENYSVTSSGLLYIRVIKK